MVLIMVRVLDAIFNLSNILCFLFTFQIPISDSSALMRVLSLVAAKKYCPEYPLDHIVEILRKNGEKHEFQPRTIGEIDVQMRDVVDVVVIPTTGYAKSKMLDGYFMEAIHLCSMILRVDPNNAEAKVIHKIAGMMFMITIVVLMLL